MVLTPTPQEEVLDHIMAVLHNGFMLIQDHRGIQGAIQHQVSEWDHQITILHIQRKNSKKNKPKHKNKNNLKKL